MATTARERTNIVELVVLMFEAAPGTSYLSQAVAIYEASGRNLQGLANILDDTAIYQSLNASGQTLCEFTRELIGPLGLQNDTAAIDFIASRWVAGESKGQIAYEALQVLNSFEPSSSGTQYQKAEAALLTKTVWAEYYSVTKGLASTDLDVLRGLILPITEDPGTWPPIVIDDPIILSAHGPVEIVGSAPVVEAALF